ncbi:MAG: type IV secretion system protein [Crenarchaeota archaeon]|jgi:type IV secretion system protein VirB6|nr:type IV secretion system protein [Thermoproteota archaeon]
MFDLFIDVYGYIFKLFTTDIVNVLKNTIGGVIEQIAPLFLVGFSVYVLLLGFNWLREGIDESFIGTVKSLIGWLLLIAIAFNANNYMMIAIAAYELPDKLGAVFMNVDFENTSPFNDVLIIVNKIVKKFNEAHDKLKWWEFPFAQMIYFYVAGSIIQICALALFLLVFAFYLITKISLLLTLFLGPVFIGFMLYPSTRQYGMNWIGQILNYTFTILLYILANGLIMQVAIEVFTQVNDRLDGNTIIQIPAFAAMYSAIVVLVVTGLLFFVFFNIPSIASALTGGASISASGGLRFLFGLKGALAMRSLGAGIRSGGSIANAGKNRK